MCLNKFLKDAMTIGELKELLDDFPDDAPICFTYDYGDIGNTEVVKTIESVEDVPVTYSSYHRSLKIIESEDNDENFDEVIVLRGR